MENYGLDSELWKTSAFGTVIAYRQEYSHKDRLEIDFHKQYILDLHKIVADRHNFDSDDSQNWKLGNSPYVHTHYTRH